MDQDPSNGSANEKRNWRERLGIGAKEMPKLSDEFKPDRVPPSLNGPAAAPQPVSRPAPMAPRQASRATPAAPRASQAAAPAPSRAPAPTAQPPQQSALADKLRAQRDAAERLAAQRVTAARERAEARTAAESRPAVPEPRQSAPEVRAPAPEPRLPLGRPAASDKPKFSFADDTPSPPAYSRGAGLGAQPLAPPRPALGGERMPPVPPRSLGANPNLRQDPPPYRPIDPATGYPSMGQRGGYAPPPRPYGNAPAPAAPPMARRGAFEPAPRAPVDDGYGPEEDFAPDPRLTRSMANKARQQPLPPPDADDVFEDPPAPPPRRRASAADYNAAYREAEENLDEPSKRSSGPWLLLLALLLAAVATGGVVWFYQTKMKPVASNGTSSEQVPVVAAPDQPVKTAPEAPADQSAQTPAPASKKQIYDRIVGDQEVQGGQMVPTEQPPVQPEPAAAGQDAAQPLPEPGGATDNGGAGDATPLPLPPPPGDNSAAPGGNTQGSLDNNQIQPAANQAAGTSLSETDQNAASGTQAPQTGTQTASDSTAQSDSTSQQLENIGDSTVDAAAGKATQAANDGAAIVNKKPVAAKKVKTAAKTAAKPAPQKNLGSKPVVLVPPSQDAAQTGGDTALPPSQDTNAVIAEAPGQGAVVEPPPAQKKKTIFDLFKGGQAAQTAPAEPVQNTPVVSNETVEPVPQPAPQKKAVAAPQTTGGSGFVAQLASFRSQAEAQTEYARLKAKYPGIVSPLSPNISTATVAGSTRYRLGLGPMGSREDASRVCGSLLASGERDCIVRKQ